MKEGATFLHHKIFTNLLLNPLMSLTAIFNCGSNPSKQDHATRARRAAMCVGVCGACCTCR